MKSITDFKSVSEYNEYLRAYFAARAPKVVPGWFEPVMAEYPVRTLEETVFYKFNEHPKKHFLAKWDNENEKWTDPDIIPQDFKTEVEQFVGEAKQIKIAQEEWHNDRAKQRVFQWPWYWADQVLQAKPN